MHTATCDFRSSRQSFTSHKNEKDSQRSVLAHILWQCRARCCLICCFQRAVLLIWADALGASISVSNGPSGGQIMLIAIMLALWRMYR